MKRRQFFTRLAAGIAGAAIAPRVAAEIIKDPETTPAFDTEMVDKRIEELKDYSSYNDHCFHGKKIRWNNKGKIRCTVDHGKMPRVNDMVLLNLLDDHHLPIMAMVTSVEDRGSSGDVTMITLDSEDPDKMVDLVGRHPDVVAWQAGMDTPPGWIMSMRNEDAFMGMCYSNAFPEPPYRYVDPRQYPMTPDEAYDGKHVGWIAQDDKMKWPEDL